MEYLGYEVMFWVIKYVLRSVEKTMLIKDIICLKAGWISEHRLLLEWNKRVTDAEKVNMNI